MKKICWILSTVTAFAFASPCGAAQPTSVACTVQHSKYGTMGGELRFSLSAGKESIVVQGPAATLLILDVEDIGTKDPVALITVRGDMNYIRFNESKENFTAMKDGLEGFGSKTLAMKNPPINFQLVTSTGKPGLINVDCRLDHVTRLPAHARNSLEVDFFAK